MFAVFKATLSPMLVLFLCIVFGFALKKLNFLPDNSATVLAKLENYLLVPALIIRTFMRYCTVSSIMGQARLIFYSLILLALSFIFANVLSHAFIKKDYYKRNVYKYALAFGNFSFMGNAIVPAILGDEALYLYMLFILPLNVAVYTWGVAILVPKGKKSKGVFARLLDPVILSMFIGAFLGLTGLGGYVPEFVNTAINNCADCMGPLAMVLTGFVIGGYHFGSLLKNVRVYIATFLRLIVFPAIFVGALYLIGADKTACALAFFAYGTPLGLNTVVFPSAYGGDTSTGASMAMISHTLCVVTIPLMYALITLIL